MTNTRRGKDILVILLIIVSLASTGCWNRRELTTMAIVLAVGIDMAEDDRIQLTVQIVKADEFRREGGSGKEKFLVMTSTGYTIFDAVRNFIMESGRKLFWSHIKVIVIGEGLARDGVAPVLDFFDRDHEPRRESWLLIAKGATAKEIIEAEHKIEGIPALAVKQLVEGYRGTGIITAMNLHHFLTAMNTPGIEPAVTAIHLLKRLHDDENKDGFIAEGAAVFKKDRLAGWLDRTETRGVNWINGRVVSGILAVQSPVDHSKRVSVEIVRSDSTITPEYKNGRLSVTVEIRMEGTLGEQLSGSAMAIPEQVEELQKHVNDQILKEAGSALAAAQDKYKTDVFGFGREVSRRIPKLWKELDGRWEDEFSQLHVIVRVESKIRATGLASDPVRPD